MDAVDGIRWSELPRCSMRRMDWDKIYAPLVGIFAAGKKPEKELPCTPQRLEGLRNRAKESLSRVEPEFDREAKRLGRERYWILGGALLVTMVAIVIACLTTSHGYDAIKTLIAAGGTGGLLTWSISLAFRRVDHETQLRLLPKVFAVQFAMCKDCKDYEDTFIRFAEAVEKLRGGK